MGRIVLRRPFHIPHRKDANVVSSTATSEQSGNGLTHAVASVATGECEHERRGHECCFSHHYFFSPENLDHPTVALEIWLGHLIFQGLASF